MYFMVSIPFSRAQPKIKIVKNKKCGSNMQSNEKSYLLKLDENFSVSFVVLFKFFAIRYSAEKVKVENRYML